MPDSSPLHTLLSSFLPASDAAAVEQEAAKVADLPAVRSLGELRTPAATHDPNELIMHRFLCRGGICLLLGPTGAGKSSLLMQLAIHFAAGKPLFGITPGMAYLSHGIRILLIQAENDEGELAEMRDGVLAGCAMTDSEKALSLSRIMVSTINDRSSDRFAGTLDALLTEHGPFDLTLVDPAFAYIGGDSNSQRDVSRFVRELLNPILHRHQVGMILTHHTNKPLRGAEKDNWEAGDYAYLGAGSAEWVNAARAVIAIRSIGSDSVFELRSPKRGKRLRWEDEDGHPTVVQHIAHAHDAGMICWRKAGAAEVETLLPESRNGRPRTCPPTEILHCVTAHPGLEQQAYRNLASEILGCSPFAVQRAFQECVDKGWLRFDEDGRAHRYHVTTKGQAKAATRPSTHPW